MAVSAAAVTGLALVALAHQRLMEVLWPARLPATALAILLWWLALTPSAIIAARFRARRQGDALAAGRLDPARADVIRSAAWEAELRDLSKAAGVDTLVRPPRVHRPLAIHTEYLGVAAIHDPRTAGQRSWTRRRSRSAESTWHRGSWAAIGRLVLPQLPPRVVMLGGSGSGKTVAQHRMVAAALNRGWRVLWLDGKGDPDDASQLLEHATACGGTTRWLNLSAPGGRDSYFLWRGDGSSVARKAASLMPRPGTGGTEHFAALGGLRTQRAVRTAVALDCRIARAGACARISRRNGRSRTPGARNTHRQAARIARHRQHRRTDDRLTDAARALRRRAARRVLESG